jgi:Kef-type K+ transport system membrane component KefB/mannitol/fructose-specific phosphotransferase system IIA component
MNTLNPENITVLFLSLGILLGAAHICGELAQRLRQPAILGELIAGVLLGPTVLGNMLPGVNLFLFPQHGSNAIALETITSVAVVLFLLIAGMEVDLSLVRKQGYVAPKVSITGIVIPFFLGFTVAWLIPGTMGRLPEADRLTFALFFATAMSISALPVIAKTLMDMGLYRSDFGMLIVSAAIVNDLIGWIIFAIVLGMMGTTAGQENHIMQTIALTLVFTGLMLTLGRWLIHRTLPFLQAYTKWPGGVMGFALTLAMLGAAATEWIGIHAIFGSFLVGVAIGDSSHLRERTRVTIEHFVSFIFAPVFFASIGLKVNFLTDFNIPLILTVLVIACVCKLLGGILGARWGGMSPRDSWAVGFAMNSRGAMEIILGMLALDAKIISQQLFVALVVMAIVTSMMSGPMMRFILKPVKRRGLKDALSPKLYLRKLKADSARSVIKEMTAVVCEVKGLDAGKVETAVWAREEALATGIGNGVAIPHARIDGLRDPVVAVGISETGIDFNAPDDKLANVIFLILTPIADSGAQLEIVAEIARLFKDQRLYERMLRTKNLTDFRALLKSIAAESASV